LIKLNRFESPGPAITVALFVLAAGTGAVAFNVYGQQPPAPANSAAPLIDYNWDIRPILSDNCFRCHGPDAKSRQAGLRLDQKESAYAQAIVPGKPEESELISRIIAKDPAYRMPLGGKQLSGAEIETLREWIRQGAEYKPHWSFITPGKPALPQTRLANQNTSAIDRFILARLEREGLTASREADKETLINRVTLTLTGLPPALAEVDAFLKDESPNAYEKLVDRLLASPHYGEHMAAYWANISRYSESDGFLDDHHDRLFWPYRDWVIAAFNKNMPFDQFGTWQIAGDLLPNATKEQKLATAFLRVGKRTTENGAIDEEYRVEYTLDRANVIGGGFLALTTGCARCHDHKYDPIAQKDYYSLAGFFNSADEPGFHAPGFSTIQGGPTLRWADDATEAKIAAAEKSLRAAENAYEAARQAASKDIAARIGAILKQSPAELAASVQKSIEAATVAYYPFETTAPIPEDQMPRSRARRGQRPPPELVSPFRRGLGSNPGANAAEEVAQQRAFAMRLPNSMIKEKIVFSPSGLPGGEPAVLEEANIKPGGAKGNALFFTDTNRGFLGKSVGFYDRTQPFSFDLWVYAASEYENSQILNHRDDDNSGGAGYKLSFEKNHLSFYMMHSWPYNMLHVVSKQAVPVKEWTHIAITYDGSSRAAGIKLYINGEPADAEVEHDQLTESSLPRSFAPVFNEFVGVEFGRRFREVTPKDGGIDEIRFFNKALTRLEVSYLHKGAAAMEMNSTGLAAALTDLEVSRDPRVIEAGKVLYEAREAENQAVSWVPEVLVMADAPKPRQTYVLSRGLYNVHLDPVDPAPLVQIFPFDPQLPRNRAGLAKWLFDPKNPLVARVFVNRMWQLQFGTGIVETSDDFGMQGSRPTHPDLLDWLAVDFIESGWDIKRLNKMIVMSAAFRQSSDASPELLKRDPDNRLYARGPRYRMSAEQVRDHALAVSGLLVQTIGGPSAYPYQPEGVWVPGVTQYDYPKPESISPDNHHRRSLYTFVKRNTPPPSMSVFDFSERHTTLARRLTSNTPLQALVLMDDPQYVEAYRVLATRVLKEQPEHDGQIKLVFRLATRRMPKDSEFSALKAFYESELVRFAGEKKKAEELVHVGVTPVDPAVDIVQMAALTNVAAAVMNTPDAYSIH
jgi:mono/diheme cytochrome c family protein